jgi:hypothetical protein
MLETTLSTPYVPGTNVKGQVAGANWSFLLPNLELERSVCFGSPLPTTLSTLSRLSQEVILVCPDLPQPSAGQEAEIGRSLSNVTFTTLSDDKTGMLPNGTVDLALIADWHNIRHRQHDGALVSELLRLLKPEGVIYFEFGDFINRLSVRQVKNDLARVFGVSQLFWLTPMTGEMSTAVSLNDHITRNFFLRHKLYTPSIRLPVFDRAERFLEQHPLFGRFVRRYGVLIGRVAAEVSPQPPQYLRSIAQNGGVNIDQHRWGLSARGKYSSRKVLFFLFDGDSVSPEYIVKMTRDQTLNPRLENEYQALLWLQEKGIGDEETLPRGVFMGYHGGLAVVGESMIHGQPFRRRTKATADCPHGRAVIEWLIDLGAATADSAVATPAQVADVLEELLTRFMAIYRLAPKQIAFLRDQIRRVACSQQPFPLIFQHGDPGTWNIIITKDERVALLDWEAAEPQGMPLWDLFYFLRSYCTGAARKQGIRDSLKGFEHLFLSESPFNSLVVEATRRYCQQTKLAERLVEPLFYTCWLHRALKQATHLPSAKVETGHYVNLLRLCIDRRSSPILRTLFAHRGE